MVTLRTRHLIDKGLSRLRGPRTPPDAREGTPSPPDRSLDDRLADVAELHAPHLPVDPAHGREQLRDDMVRLYEQGWPIHRVAEEFGVSYRKTRRILNARIPLRGPSRRKAESRETGPQD